MTIRVIAAPSCTATLIQLLRPVRDFLISERADFQNSLDGDPAGDPWLARFNENIALISGAISIASTGDLSEATPAALLALERRRLARDVGDDQLAPAATQARIARIDAFLERTAA